MSAGSTYVKLIREAADGPLEQHHTGKNTKHLHALGNMEVMNQQSKVALGKDQAPQDLTVESVAWHRFRNQFTI